jgi:hypothetical protein
MIRETPNEERADDRGESLGLSALSAALSVCRCELQQQLASGASVESLRASVSNFATVAHRQDVPPERLLAAFKEMTLSLPEVARLRVTQRGAIMHQLVQIVIESYYGTKDD